MALIKCIECEKEISDKAVACPHCGAPIIDENKEIAIAFVWNKKIVYSTIVIVIVLLIWFYIIPYLISQGSHHSGKGDTNSSISAIEKIMPESKNIQTVRNGILPKYPQITVGKAFDGYTFFKSTEWSEFINSDNETVVAVKCIFDQKKLGLDFQVERQKAIDGRGWRGSPNLCENDNSPCKITVNNETITFYFILNQNNTFYFSGADAAVTINGVELKTSYNHTTLLDPIYSNNLKIHYILPYLSFYWDYYHKIIEPKKKINNNYSFTQNSNITDSEYSELKKISSDYASIEAKMIQTYSKLKKSLPNDAIGLLENDQNRWLNERNQGALNAGTKGSKEYLDELIRLTNERTKELHMQLGTVSPKEALVNDHLGEIKMILAQNLQYPKMAQKLKMQGDVKIAFLLERDGSITNIKVVESSGYDLLDRDAVELIEKTASKFPKPTQSVRISVPLSYVLR